jgi:type IV pilus assembly protein PilN
MIRINLLTREEPKGSERKPGIRNIFLLALGAILAFIIIGYWILGAQVRRLDEEKLTLEKQAQGFSTLQREIKELKDKKELAQNRLTLLTRLEKERHGPVRLLEQLAVALPVNQLWLTSLKETDSEIRLEGMSLSNQILADYMKRLETLEPISRVDLIQSGQITYPAATKGQPPPNWEIKIKQFTITALKKGAERPQTPVEKK